MKALVVALLDLGLGLGVPLGAAWAQEMPPFVARGEPGPMHAALEPLLGTFSVDKETFMAGGTAEAPLRGDGLETRRRSIAGGRFVVDVTEGVRGGRAYHRTGILGYSTMDRRYEWVTADALNANMMIYLGGVTTEPGGPISMSGTFTDQGLVAEALAGRTIGQRTVIAIDGPDRHVIELFLRPPGGAEFLADRAVYTRVAP